MTESGPVRKSEMARLCYCKGAQSDDKPLLVCSTCENWFHQSCLQDAKVDICYGDKSYQFVCFKCNTPSGNEIIERPQKSWFETMRDTLYHLHYVRREVTFFNLQNDIFPQMSAKWATFCPNRKQTDGWQEEVLQTLEQNVDFFENLDGNKTDFRLKDIDYGRIYDMTPLVVAKKGKKGDKKSDRRADKNGEKTKERSKKEEKQYEWTITRLVVEDNPPGPIAISNKPLMTAPQMEISPNSNNLTITNAKGYRMCRATHGVDSGTWYYEMNIEPHEGNTRLGWSTHRGDLQAPVGFDEHSYSYRDVDGSVFHQRVQHLYGQPYGSGDVIGFLIHLPEETKPLIVKKPREERVFSATRPEMEKLDELVPHLNSTIEFYKNGKPQGIAFSGLSGGTYYPAASLYKGGKVTFNFGPNFRFPPPPHARAFSELEYTAPTPPPAEATETAAAAPEPPVAPPSGRKRGRQAEDGQPDDSRQPDSKRVRRTVESVRGDGETDGESPMEST